MRITCVLTLLTDRTSKRHFGTRLQASPGRCRPTFALQGTKVYATIVLDASDTSSKTGAEAHVTWYQRLLVTYDGGGPYLAMSGNLRVYKVG